jgi:hypothetical protein
LLLHSTYYFSDKLILQQHTLVYLIVNLNLSSHSQHPISLILFVYVHKLSVSPFASCSSCWSLANGFSFVCCVAELEQGKQYVQVKIRWYSARPTTTSFSPRFQAQADNPSVSAPGMTYVRPLHLCVHNICKCHI